MNPSEAILLLTRPHETSVRFAAEAEAALGKFGSVVVSPLIAIEPLVPFPDVPHSSVLVFTSQHGVVAAKELGGDGRVAWCVGPRTTEVAEAYGFSAKDGGGDAASLAETIVSSDPGAPVLHIVGQNQRGSLVERLQEARIDAQRLVVYDQVAQPLSREAKKHLNGGKPVLVPLFSPRSATLFSEAVPPDAEPMLLLAHLSPAVAANTANLAPAAEIIARQPNTPALIGAMSELLEAYPAP